LLPLTCSPIICVILGTQDDTFLCQFCVYSGVSGEGSGVTVKGSFVAEPVATPPAADTKASIFLMIDISIAVLVSFPFCIVWFNYNVLLTFH